MLNAHAHKLESILTLLAQVTLKVILKKLLFILIIDFFEM